MRLIDADALLTDRRMRMYYHLPNGDIAVPVIDIEHAPTIEERKTGRWIPRYDRPKQEVFICSECGGFAYSPWTGSRKTPKKNWCKYRFCPNCGADMRGEQHETD